jgi:hypothetical protein
MINASLENATTMAVSSNINTVSTYGVEDELSIGWREFVEALLDDMIAVQVLDKLNNSESESVNDGLNLTGRGDEFNHLLQSPSSMLVESIAKKVVGCVLYEKVAFFLIAELK